MLFFLFGSLTSIEAYRHGDRFYVVFGIVFSSIFGILFLLSIIALFKSIPYLVLTKDELLINTSFKRTISIQWEDIEKFKMIEAHFNQFLEVRLVNVEKYESLLSSSPKKFNTIKDKNLSRYFIKWGIIRRKDREKLIRELDERTVGWTMNEQIWKKSSIAKSTISI